MTIFRNFKQSNKQLLLLIGLLHLYYYVTFGATFWVDSLNYVRLAHALKSSSGLASFYASDGYWFCSHIQPGISFVWLIVSLLPTPVQWPVLALAQHAFAAGSLYWVFSVANRYWPTKWHLLFSGILCLLPFYQNFHNALLTESISSSLLLVAVGLSVRLLMESEFHKFFFWFLLIVLIVITQIRSYFGPLVTLCGLYILFQRKFIFSRYTVFLAIAAAIAALAFPIYRAICIGEFFLPHIGGLDRLVVSSLADPEPGKAIEQAWRQMPLPSDEVSSRIVSSGLSWDEAERIALYWQKLGFSRDQIEFQSRQISDLYQRDHCYLGWQRIGLALTTLGIVEPLFFHNPRERFVAKYSGPEYARHCLNDGYYWHSRIAQVDYSKIFDTYFLQENSEDDGVPGANSAREGFAKAWKLYINSHPASFRDPLRLGILYPDFWALPGLFSIAIVCIRFRTVGLVLLSCVLLNFLVLGYSPLGGLRYSYALFPLYLFSVSLVVGIFQNRAVFSPVVYDADCLNN